MHLTDYLFVISDGCSSCSGGPSAVTIPEPLGTIIIMIWGANGILSALYLFLEAKDQLVKAIGWAVLGVLLPYLSIFIYFLLEKAKNRKAKEQKQENGGEN
jgi:hypothetical protein